MLVVLIFMIKFIEEILKGKKEKEKGREESQSNGTTVTELFIWGVEEESMR